MGNWINDTNVGDNIMQSPHKKSFAAEELARRQQKKKPWGSIVAVAVLGAVVIVAAVYVFFGRQDELQVPAQTVSEAEEIPSIAVLSFNDMSPDKDQEWFCDGISEEIINNLTRIRDLTVIARSSAFVFKEEYRDIKAIGDSLGVDYVLEGSVRKVGNDLRITAQLIRVSNQNHV